MVRLRAGCGHRLDRLLRDARPHLGRRPERLGTLDRLRRRRPGLRCRHPTGLDGQQAYTLSFDGAPHPQQGYHVKLTVSTPRSKGNDTKTKVFWVAPCDDDTTTTPGDDDETTTGDDTDDETTTGDHTDDETTTDDHTDDETTTNDTTTDDHTDETVTSGDTSGGAQGGGSVSADDNGAQVPTAVDAGEQHPVVDFVTSPVPLVVIALGALLTAGALVTRRRTRAGQ